MYVWKVGYVILPVIVMRGVVGVQQGIGDAQASEFRVKLKGVSKVMPAKLYM